MIDKSALEGMLGTNEKMDIERTVVKTCLGDGVTEMYDIWLARRGDDIQVGPREAGEAGCLGGVLLRKRHVEKNGMMFEKLWERGRQTVVYEGCACLYFVTASCLARLTCWRYAPQTPPSRLSYRVNSENWPSPRSSSEPLNNNDCRKDSDKSKIVTAVLPEEIACHKRCLPPRAGQFPGFITTAWPLP